MSKPLCIIASTASAATQPGSVDLLAALPLTLLSAGVVAQIAWAITVFRRPSIISLRDAAPRHNTIHPGVLLCVFVGFHLYAVLFMAIAAAQHGLRLFDQGPAGLPMQVTLPANFAAQFFYLGFALWVASTSLAGGLRHGLGLTASRWPSDLARGLLACLWALPLCMALQALMLWLIGIGLLPIQVQQHPVLTFLRQSGRGWLWLIVAITVVMAPLAEELFFRGLLQTYIRRHLGPWPAVAVASAVFTLVHVGVYQDYPALFALALTLGYLYERTGRLLPSIVAHASFNGIMVLMEAIQP